MTTPRRTRPPIRTIPKAKFAKVVTKARGRKKVVFTSKPPPPLPEHFTSKRVQASRQQPNIRVSNIGKKFAGALTQASKASGRSGNFGKGSSVTFTTQKGGVQKVRLVSKDKTRSTTFILPAKEKVRRTQRDIDFKTKTRNERQGRKPETKSTGVRRKTLGKILSSRRLKKSTKGLRSRPRPERLQPPPTREFGSDFDIFRVSSVGNRAQITRQSTRTNRAGVKKRSGVPQTSRIVVSDLRKARATARTSEQRGQRIGSSRTPLNTRGGELKREFGQQRQGSDFDIFRMVVDNNQRINTAGRDVGKNLRQGLELHPIAQISKFASERISNKPLAKKDRIGSDFDILNFFG